MYKPFIFLNAIIITTIILFTSPLNAQRIGPSKNNAEWGFHKRYKYHEYLYNHNSLKVREKSKNEFCHRNRIKANHENRDDNKGAAGPPWLNDQDIFPGDSISPPFLK